ncbi:MAG: hypothetical protein KAW12_10425 [Candidatus Aminicenantes bacterium]|nr:hypothetical protein [Candidatus Aminicenantes bacterium]
MKKIKYAQKFFVFITAFSFLFVSLLVSYSGQGSGQTEAPGKLSKAHRHLSGKQSCGNCHAGGKKAKHVNCLTCHKELARRIKAGHGYHRDKQEDCEACHQEHRGENQSLIQWEIKDFDHADTGYLLSGAHRSVRDCDRCHKPANAPARKYSKSFLLKDSRCSACHRDAHRGNRPVCGECHQTIDWSVDIW